MNNRKAISPSKSPTKRPSPSKRGHKIEHQIENEGCKCALCLRLALQKLKIIKDEVPVDMILEKRDTLIKKDSQPYFINYLTNFYVSDRNRKRMRFIIPEICVFEKGLPSYLFSKKKEQYPLKLIKTKEKLNFYEVKNFFFEGYLHHNKYIDLNGKSASKNIISEVRDKQTLKNECIVIARYSNNPGQIMSYSMLDNMFKSNQKQFRSTLLYMQTIVGSKNYEEIRVRVSIEAMKMLQVYQRAKTEVKILNDQIKSNQLSWVSERQEIEYEEFLKKTNTQGFLEYYALKLILLNSFHNERCIQQATFRFTKSSFSDTYYFVDLHVHRFCERESIWGILIVEQKVHIELQNKILKKHDELQNRFKHLENNPATKAIQSAMLQDYNHTKQHYLGKYTLQPIQLPRRQVVTECSSTDINNENTAPVEKLFRISKNNSVARRPPSVKKFTLY